MSRLIGLADANNFFVSCERVFRPDLRFKPVVVLSNNDGCVIARSNEVKAMNVPMGAPLFQWKKFFEYHGVTIFSGNMALYRSFSDRVANTLARFTDVVERYSIDESFFNLAIAAVDDPAEYCRMIRATILHDIGIPVSIGVSTTKTLCKLGSEVAKACGKRNPDDPGVCELLPLDAIRLFDELPIDEIWGIGPQMAKKLREWGISTVGRLLRKDDDWIRKNMTIRGLQTVRELRGISCFPLCEHEEKQKSLMVSESFGTRLSDFEDIKNAVVKHAADGAFRLRRGGLRAGVIGCELRTSYFVPNIYRNHASVSLTPPTSQTGEIVAAAIACLKEIFVPGIEYAKSGICCERLEDADDKQLCLGDLDPQRQKQDRLMAALDEINCKFGLKTIYPASMHDTRKSDPHRAHLSQWDKSI